MIWTFRIECIGGIYIKEDCVRVVEIDSGISLLNLHEIILSLVGFDRDHLFEFFAGRDPYNRKIEFVEDFWDKEIASVFEEYGKIVLEDIFPLPKSLKLFYHFDFGDDWFFWVRKTRKKPKNPEKGVKYPNLIESIGPNPPQYGSEEDWEE
jgi:pRiA4b ORF-3-like protein